MVTGRDYHTRSRDERETLVTFLDYARATVRAKCAGLSESDARRVALPGSPAMTIAGLVGHLHWTERAWIEAIALGDPAEDRRIDAEPDGGMIADPPETLAELLDRYDARTARNNALIAGLDLDARSRGSMGDRDPVTLRWILLHLIEGTSRHNGHLDILRELADGTTGS